ncbi:MAG: tetratricopeptide repeat protein [Chitinophagales bacterium]|nr:tetratricopeptide repeat protein [Chitinophagales bacterium]MDW8418367.1 tetratricopeptide repeat protein [Chitinophagales bacterium]
MISPVQHSVVRCLWFVGRCMIFGAVFFFIEGRAQTIAQLQKAAEKKFSEGDYYAAAQYYEQALRKNPDDLALQYQLAEAYRLYNDYAGAAAAYRLVYNSDKQNKFPLAAYWLGVMLRSTCECKADEAATTFKKFRSKYRKNDYYAASAAQHLESIAWANEHKKPIDSIHIYHFGTEINSPYAEFNARSLGGDTIMYSALRPSNHEKHSSFPAGIYYAISGKSTPVYPPGADAAQHVCNGSFSPDGRHFYFTQCENKPGANQRCDIYVSRIVNGQPSDAVKLPAIINEPGANNTHPSVGIDERGHEVLFFSTNRGGGAGGMDIWMSRINPDGTYQQPVPLGKPVNTPGNEVTPFYDITTHTLYFSSDWHYGFGGYDIFQTHREGEHWANPVNMLQPVNSPQNDLYYTLSTDRSHAFITSNRTGSYFIKAQTCCSDIYVYHTGLATSRTDTAVTLSPPDTPVRVQPPVTPVLILDDKLRSVKQLLPIKLYFHNDEPDARTLSDTTSLDYRQTYEAYSALRFEYEKMYTQGLRGDKQEEALREIRDWFEKKVDKGYYDLVAFTSRLYELLLQGEKIEVTVRAYCSPLNYNAYNIHLGNRRAASLNNYFYHYREGALLPYLNRGQLTIKNISLGEETSPPGISDSRTDTRNSVFNPMAAAERRVEITAVEIK